MFTYPSLFVAFCSPLELFDSFDVYAPSSIYAGLAWVAGFAETIVFESCQKRYQICNKISIDKTAHNCGFQARTLIYEFSRRTRKGGVARGLFKATYGDRLLRRINHALKNRPLKRIPRFEVFFALSVKLIRPTPDYEIFFASTQLSAANDCRTVPVLFRN